MNVASLFSSAGIAESRLDEIGIKSIVANELIEERCNLYSCIHPKTEIVCGDITQKSIKDNFLRICRKNKIDTIMATPPCQGMSLAGSMNPKDPRNHLIKYALDIVIELKPKYVFLENVPRQLKTRIEFQGKDILIPDYIYQRLGSLYNFAPTNLIKAMDFGIPQMRQRNIILCTRKDKKKVWELPSYKESVISLDKAIGHYPSIDPLAREGMKQTYEIFPDFDETVAVGKKFSKWHFPPTHACKHIKTMQKTPSGKTAFDNKIFYPKKDDGSRVSGHYNHYRRLDWEKPSRSLTQNNGVISSLACVHPGRQIISGDEKKRLFSDARCFTIKELFTISSINFDEKLPVNTSELLIRKVIGEGIPPLLTNKIFKEIAR